MTPAAWALVAAFLRHYSQRCGCTSLDACFKERERLLDEVAPYLPTEASA